MVFREFPYSADICISENIKINKSTCTLNMIPCYIQKAYLYFIRQ